MKTVFILFFIGVNLTSTAQIIPSVKKLQGIWRFEDEGFKNYLIIKGNKKIELDYWNDDKKSSVIERPFGYFGFWDNNDKPRKISELKEEGKHIYFYDELGTSYDALGSLIKETRYTLLTFNEDEDDNNFPPILRFYYKGTPDVYIKVDSIPGYVLVALKKNVKSWQVYVDFIGIKEEKKIKTGKAIIYSLPNKPSKMFLVNGNTITVLQEKDNWIYILYVTTKNKEIRGWIKKEDVNNN